jgi:hypothetical protein
MGTRKQIGTATHEVHSGSAGTLTADHRPLERVDVSVSSANSAGWIQTLGRRLFCFPVLLGALLLGGVVVSLQFSLPDPDTWFHIAAGEEILATHSWPRTDHYSFTAYGNESIAPEWLGEVLIAASNRLGGLSGLMLLLVIGSCILMLLLYYYATLHSGNSKAAFVACALLLPLVTGFCHLRPQLFGYVLLVGTLISLERFRQGRQKSLWVLPALLLIWVNLHGTFIFGLMAIALYWVSGLVGFRFGGVVAERWTATQRRHLLLVMLSCFAVLPVTPYGAQLAGYTFHVIHHASLGMANITEYQPLGSYTPLLKLFLAFILPFLLAQVLFPLSYRLEEIALVLAGVYGACVHSRLLFFFALVFAPALALLLARWIPNYEPAKDRYLLNATVILLISAGLFKASPSTKDLKRQVDVQYPSRALDYLRAHPVAGAMLNDYGWGGYLIWTSPERKVFIDGRSQIYEDNGVYQDYLRIMGVERNTLPLLRKYKVESCLVPADSAIVTFLATLPDWQRVYSDDLSAILVRRKAPED